MRRKLGMLCGAAVLAGSQIGGCLQAIPLVPVDVPLTGGLASFSVQAGSPAKNTGTTSFDSGGITIGRGNLELDPSVISVTPVGTGGGKVVGTALQGTGAIEDCQTACAAAGLAQADCGKICQDQTLRVSVWLDSTANAATVCDTGVQFGPFEVTLVDNVPTAVSPNAVNLQPGLALLNSGEFSICIEVISPIAGTVAIGGITFNVGL